jgi:hypothetical protein
MVGLHYASFTCRAIYAPKAARLEQMMTGGVMMTRRRGGGRERMSLSASLSDSPLVVDEAASLSSTLGAGAWVYYSDR